MPRGKRRWLIALPLALLAAALLSGGLRPEWHLQAFLWLQHELAGVDEHEARIDGIRWSYLEAGSNNDEPPLVLVHGFTGSKDNWLPIVRTLAPDRRLLIPDLPGWNDSERQTGADVGFAAQAENLSQFIDTVVAGPVDLVGHSMGGGIVAVLAARHPSQVHRLVLMDAAGVRFRDNDFGLAVLAGENPFAVHDRDSLRHYLGTVFQTPPFVPWPIDRALIDRRIADAPFEQSVLDAIARGSEAFLPGECAPSIKANTLLLWCRDDRVIDVSAADLWAEALPRSRTRLLSGCNHMPMMEQPDATAAALLDFLR
ncbi:MAG: alpha/beta fold hydrolase [Xanthomonadales bacterium]|nr:alpha/beta fold hydrolase [Xanthomonadales bacterium]